MSLDIVDVLMLFFTFNILAAAVVIVLLNSISKSLALLKVTQEEMLIRDTYDRIQR